MGNIIQDGIIMIAVLSVIIICWLVLSTPFEDVISSFEDVNSTASDSEVEDAAGDMRTVWNLFFGGLAMIPIVWFVVRVFQRDPEWRY